MSPCKIYSGADASCFYSMKTNVSTWTKTSSKKSLKNKKLKNKKNQNKVGGFSDRLGNTQKLLQENGFRYMPLVFPFKSRVPLFYYGMLLVTWLLRKRYQPK